MEKKSYLLHKMKKSKKYIVFGWLNGHDYDCYKPANYTVEISAKDESEADEKGDKKLAKLHGKCEVIVSELKQS